MFIEILKLMLILSVSVFAGYIILDGRQRTFELKSGSIYGVIGLISTAGGLFFLSFLTRSISTAWLIMVLIILGVGLRYKPKKINIQVSKPAILVSLLGVFILTNNSFFEGLRVGGLTILNAQEPDSLWHIALQQSILTSFPPESPIFSGTLVHGYHYLNDVFWATVSSVSGISIFSTYLVIAPICLAILYSSTTLMLMNSLTKNRWISTLGYFLVIAGSGLTYLNRIIYPSSSTGQSVFWLDQPPYLMINQQLVLSLATLNVIYLLLQKNKQYWPIIGVLIGLLFGIKIYAAILLLPILAIVGIYQFWKTGQIFLLLTTFLGGLIGGLVVFLVGGNGSFPFIFEPGWFIRTSLVSVDRLNQANWSIVNDLYLEKHNYLHLGWHWIQAIWVFLLGNLGLKIFVLLPAFWLLIKGRGSQLLVITLLMVGFSILVPMMILQKGVVWNTIQFMQFAQVGLAVLLLITLNRLVNVRVRIAILLVLLISGLPTTTKLVTEKLLPSSYTKYDRQLVDRLTNFHPEPGQILLVGSHLNKFSLIPALTGRPVFYTDQTINNILLVDTKERGQLTEDVENYIKPCPKNSYLFLGGDQIDLASSAGMVISQTPKLLIIHC